MTQPAAAASRIRTTSSLTLPRQRSLELGPRCLIMGVVNLTPDSFSDGGLWFDPDRAVEHGLELLAEGADLLDLGAESTRPGGGVYGDGARLVSAEEELRRLLPVLERLRGATEAPLSVDTRKGVVARAALAAGADLINDVSALEDPDLAAAAAEAGCPVVLMHSRGDLATMQRQIHFESLREEIAEELAHRVRLAVESGIDRGQLILDPGIGFGKTYEQNAELLAGLDFLAPLGLPVLVGASRKSFIGHFSGGLSPSERLFGSLAALAWALRHRAALVRVHDVLASVRFAAVWEAIRDQSEVGDVG